MIRLALPQDPLSALGFIAERQGYFEDIDPRVKILKQYPSGKRALKAMLSGDADLVLANSVPIAFESAARPDLRIIATTGTSLVEANLIVRTNSKTNDPANLRGKKIGTQKASAVHYLLHLFLARNHIASSEISSKFMKAELLPKSLASGEIDAFSMREPFLSQAEALLPNQTIRLQTSTPHRRISILVTTESILQNNSVAIEKILVAMIKAEKFLKTQRSMAVKIVAEEVEIPEIKLASDLDTSTFEIKLDHSTLFQLDNVLRWAKVEKLIDDQQEISTRKIFDDRPLSRVAGNRVTLSH